MLKVGFSVFPTILECDLNSKLHQNYHKWIKTTRIQNV